jgi:chromosome segregation ATPase
MWKNIWAVIELLTTTSNRVTRLEKDFEKLEKENRDQNKEIQSLWMQLGRMAERENWREEKLKQEKEIERLRMELEFERQRRLLPPSLEKTESGGSL